MTKEKIIKILPELEKEELKDIRDRIEFHLLYYNDKDGCNKNMDIDIFYSMIKEYLFHSFKIKMPDYISVFKRNAKNDFNKLEEILQTLKTFLLDNNIENNRVNRQRLYILFIVLTTKHLKEYNIYVSISTMLSKVDRFSGLFDKAFPDYISSGCVELVF